MSKGFGRAIVVAVLVVVVVAVALGRSGLTRRTGNKVGAGANVPGELPLGLIIQTPAAVELFNHLRPTDIAIAEGTPDLALLSSITQGQIAYAYTSWSETKGALETMPSRVKVVAYDPEHHQQTPQSEQDNLVATVAQEASAVHATGREFMLLPDAQFSEQLASQLAPYPDIYLLQVQKYQGTAQFAKITADLTAQIKAANPRCQVWVQVQVTNITGTTATFNPNTAYASLASLAGPPDGVMVFTFARQPLSHVSDFLSRVRPNG